MVSYCQEFGDPPSSSTSGTVIDTTRIYFLDKEQTITTRHTYQQKHTFDTAAARVLMGDTLRSSTLTKIHVIADTTILNSTSGTYRIMGALPITTLQTILLSTGRTQGKTYMQMQSDNVNNQNVIFSVNNLTGLQLDVTTLTTGLQDLNFSSTMAGSNSWSGTEADDTVLVTGATTADRYLIQFASSTAPVAADMCTVIPLTGKFVVRRTATTGTSGMAYFWFRYDK